MTPKEKAKELVFKKFGCSKRYALLAVHEIIDNYEERYKYCNSKIYWQEVKQEIEKL